MKGTVYIVLETNGKYFGCFGTKKHCREFFLISSIKLDKIIKKYPHEFLWKNPYENKVLKLRVETIW